MEKERKRRKEEASIHAVISTEHAWPIIDCSRLSDSGKEGKGKGKRKVGGAGKSKKAALSLPSFVLFYFFRVRAFSFSGPEYLGAWNRLGQ